jgi:hypothetical protein
LQEQQAGDAHAEGVVPLQREYGAGLEGDDPREARVHLGGGTLELTDSAGDGLAVLDRRLCGSLLAMSGGAALVGELGLELLDGSRGLVELREGGANLVVMHAVDEHRLRARDVLKLAAHERELAAHLLARARVCARVPRTQRRLLRQKVVALLTEHLTEAVEQVGVALHQNEIELGGGARIDQGRGPLLPQAQLLLVLLRALDSRGVERGEEGVALTLAARHCVLEQPHLRRT